jgi:hypothetical protein
MTFQGVEGSGVGRRSVTKSQSESRTNALSKREREKKDP